MREPTFNFFQHWYPLSPVEDLKPDRPTAVTLLGQRLVVWKSPQSENFSVFLDQCPHRLAPLSEGRVDEATGTLMCSYHGWQFNSEGHCTRIPQAENPELIQQQPDNFCVASLPVKVANDLLWVWPDASSAQAAEVEPLPLSPQIDESQGFVWSSMVRDLEYDWQTLIENLADPSHVPFAHHGVQGNRDRAQPIPMKILDTNQDLIRMKSDGIVKATITFKPPCLLEYAMGFGPDKKLGLITYCLPVAPGKSRIVAQFSRNFATQFHRWTPRWWNHIFERNMVLDGDMILLRHQEQALQRDRTESWKTLYKLPTQADRMVLEFRRWIDQYCPEDLPWGTVAFSPEKKDSDRPKLLDRYHQHTIHCESCRQMLKSIQRIKLGLVAYFVLAISISVLLPDQSRLIIGGPTMITALAGLVLYSWLKYKLEPKFYFVDYVHAER